MLPGIGSATVGRRRKVQHSVTGPASTIAPSIEVIPHSHLGPEGPDKLSYEVSRHSLLVFVGAAKRRN